MTIEQLKQNVEEILNKKVFIFEDKLIFSYHGNEVRINYKAEHYAAVTSKSNMTARILVDELKTIFDKPICEYMHNNEFVIEWNFREPLVRIIELRDAKVNNLKVYDIKQYGVEKLEDLTSSKNFYYGIFPGKIISRDEIALLDQSTLAMAITMLKNRLIRAKSALISSEVANEIIQIEYAIDYCIYETRKFGVLINLSENGSRIIETDCYLNWYEYYINGQHVKSRKVPWSIDLYNQSKIKKSKIKTLKKPSLN